MAHCYKVNINDIHKIQIQTLISGVVRPPLDANKCHKCDYSAENKDSDDDRYADHQPQTGRTFIAPTFAL